MRSPPDVFHLKKHEQLLGFVHVTGVWEMFWFKVRFEPTEAFASVEPLFNRAIQALDYDEPGDVDEIWDEIISGGVVLVRSDDNTVIDCFMLHLDGEHSRLRYVEPSELEENERG
jgi:hypothetical protein